MQIRLPNIKFVLPEWQDNDFVLLHKSKEKLVEIFKKTGNGSDRFKEICERIRLLGRAGNHQAIIELINKPIDVRALTYLWAYDHEFTKTIPPTVTMLGRLRDVRDKLGLLALLQLITAFFQHFDKLADSETVGNLCHFLRRELRQRSSQSDKTLAIMAEYKDLLFSMNGPARVVSRATANTMDLDQVFKKLALDGYHDGRYQNLCRYFYYLKTLKDIPVGATHSVLEEVCKQNVYEAAVGNGMLMGHKILSILIDRADRQEISDAWQRVIMTIAGDPRVPRGSKNHQRWWMLLGEERTRKVRGWLSRFDMLLFLKVLQEYGISSGNTALQRMFPARKAFLEGLYRQGLVSDARLFISGQADVFLQRNYTRGELPEYARVSDLYRSVIYLQVGDCHIIEGSHNFKLWIFKKLPSDSTLLNYSKKSFSAQDLSYILQHNYLREYGHSGFSPVSITHSASTKLLWQASAIKALREMGVKFDLEQLFSAQDYQLYKRYHGL